MSANPGRIAAVHTLLALDGGAHLEDVLADTAPAQGPDRGLAWFIAYGVVRHRGQVDAALRPLLNTPLGSLDAPVRAALRAGAFEVLFARTQRHAAVHQAVEVAKFTGAGRARGLVNAVLRRVALPERMSPSDTCDAPAWLYARWAQRYGREGAAGWLRAATEPPPLFIVGDPEGLDVTPTPLEGVWQVTSQGRVDQLDGFHEGRWWVQDLAAVQVADLVRAAAGEHILDACAAPGGKTLRMASTGADVLAVDRSARRLGLVTDSAKRVGLTERVHVRTHDWDTGCMPGAAVEDPPEGFDAVLVDAPCTALGTLRRNPEVKWRRQLVDVLSMPESQGKILASAARHVKPGGRLVYAVCSPEPEEGPDVIKTFLQAYPTFSLDAELSTAPPVCGEDGFYGARLVLALPTA